MRAWIIHPDIRSAERVADVPAEARLDEALALARALPGLEVAGGSVVRLAKVAPGQIFGAGKLEELAGVFAAEDVGLVIVDGPVTPVQQRNLEKRWKVKLLDRTGLILEIFSDRAQTREGVIQVEMAALAYQRTRLVRAWTHLERQRGGLGFVGGPGETQIEADRRAIDTQLQSLKRQLEKVVKTRGLHRAARAKVPFPVVALVGYTNAGKSTLFNRLTGADVTAKDMLFATLDPTLRRVVLPDGREVILSDTVGFVSALPTELVAAFRATLEEVRAADLILHVRDAAHPETDAQKIEVEAVLASLEIPDATPVIEVLNKLDLLDAEAAEAALAMAARSDDLVVISAQSGAGLDDLAVAIADGLGKDRVREALRLGFDAGRRRAWLFERGLVEGERQTDEGYVIDVRWSAAEKARFGALDQD